VPFDSAQDGFLFAGAAVGRIPFLRHSGSADVVTRRAFRAGVAVPLEWWLSMREFDWLRVPISMTRGSRGILIGTVRRPVGMRGGLGQRLLLLGTFRTYIALFTGFLAALLAAGVVGLSGCGKGSQGDGGGPRDSAAPVLAAEVRQRDVPVQVRNIGTVEAYATVSVKSLITGAVVTVHIKEGQEVRKGDMLFSIDPRPTQATKDQAEANLVRDQAQYDNAARDAGRIAALFERSVATQDELDKARSIAAALAGAVKADKAAIEAAEIQLGYCRIASPIDAVAGSLLLNEGNVIKANDASLIVLNQVRPIFVSFSVPQQYLGDIRRYYGGGKLPVAVYTLGDAKRLAEGELAFIDNAVDQTTGTIRLKALFANADETLWPGQFVNAVLTLTVDKGVLVVPSEAVQSGQEGQFLYVINEDMTVSVRKVAVARTVEGYSVILDGLKPGQRVVTDGQLRLYPGAKVEIKPGPATQSASAEAPRP